MVHKVIAQLSNQQAAQVLNWTCSRTKNEVQTNSFLPSDIPFTNEKEKADYSRFLLYPNEKGKPKKHKFLTLPSCSI